VIKIIFFKTAEKPRFFLVDPNRRFVKLILPLVNFSRILREMLVSLRSKEISHEKK